MQRTDPLTSPPRDAKPPSGAQPARGAASNVRRRGRRKLFNIADGYLFSQVMEGTLRGLLWFGGLLAMFAVLSAVRKAADQTLSPSAALLFIAYQLPRIMLFALPMSVLYGTLQAFSELSGKGEIIALWAGGMSLKRMLRAPLMWGAILAVCAFVVQETVVPGAETRRNEVVAREVIARLGDGPLSFRDPARGPLERVIEAKSFDPETNTLKQPIVTLFREKQVDYLEAESGQWNQETGHWSFVNGRMWTTPRGQSARDESPIKFSFQRVERSAEQVPQPGKLRRSALTRSENLAKGNFEVVSFAELLAYRSELVNQESRLQSVPGAAQSASGKSATGDEKQSDAVKIRKLINGATYGIHDKIATPLISLALILVGAPLGLRPQRASAGFAPGMSLLVLLVYYVMWSGTSYSGKEGTINPLLMAYLSPALTILIGLALVWKKNR